MSLFARLITYALACLLGVSCSHQPISTSPPEKLSSKHIQEDIHYLLTVLRDGYVGSRYLESTLFNNVLIQLENLSTESELSSTSLAERIAGILAQLPDQHLFVYTFEDNKLRRFSPKHDNPQRVGANLQTDPKREWSLASVKTPKGRPVDVLAISSLNSGMNLNNSHWRELLTRADYFFKRPEFIVDLRSNTGGSSAVMTAFCKKLLSRDQVIERKKISLNTTISTNIRKAFSQELIDYWIKRGDDESRSFERNQMLRYDADLKLIGSSQLQKWEESTDSGYGDNPSGTYSGTIYVLMDGKTSSAAEFVIAQLDSLFRVIKVGTNTDGAVHYAFTGAAILPNSKIRVRLGTHYYPIRYGYIERQGISPDIRLNHGDDALQRALIEIDSSKDQIRKK